MYVLYFYTKIKILNIIIYISPFYRFSKNLLQKHNIMGRKKIQISRILDQRNRQVGALFGTSTPHV